MKSTIPSSVSKVIPDHTRNEDRVFVGRPVRDERSARSFFWLCHTRQRDSSSPSVKDRGSSPRSVIGCHLYPAAIQVSLFHANEPAFDIDSVIPDGLACGCAKRGSE